jgi:hypothetical protein
MQIWVLSLAESCSSQCLDIMRRIGRWSLWKPYPQVRVKVRIFCRVSSKFYKITCVKFTKYQQAVVGSANCVGTELRRLPKSKVIVNCVFTWTVKWEIVPMKQEKLSWRIWAYINHAFGRCFWIVELNKCFLQRRNSSMTYIRTRFKMQLNLWMSQVQWKENNHVYSPCC